jgi:tRNA threonylcarbamoyl adenosine modification protein YeaZ
MGDGMSTLLVIDTSAGTSVAVVHNGAVVSEHSSDNPLTHAEVIGSLIQQCLADAHVSASEITGVVSGMGPGPFTGLRVGIAAAEAFSVGAGIPLHPMVSHDAVAWQHFQHSISPIQVITDARRKEKFVTAYSGMLNMVPVKAEGPSLAPADQVPSFAGTVREVTDISAGALGCVAYAMLTTNTPFIPAQAIYLRSPDVTLSKGPKRVVQK